MKYKTLYILAIVCFMSFLSSAKQTGKGCDTNSCSCCKFNKEKAAKQAQVIKPDQSELDISPLRLSMFNM
jgi:hypothetical protein